MHPSPAPKIVRPRRWPWAVAGLSLGAMTLVGVVASYPRWADRIAVERIERTLERKLDTDVSIGSIDLDYTRIVLGNVALAEPDATFETVTVHLAENPLTAWGVEVVRVEIDGGGTAGPAHGYRKLLDRLRDVKDDPGEGASWLRKRMRLMPEELVLRGFETHVTRETGPVRAAWASTTIKARPRERTADVRLESVRAETANGKVVQAGAVSTSVDASKPLDGPVTLQIEGASTQVTERIAVGAVDGRVTISDPQATTVAVDLAGGFVDDEGKGEAGLWSLEGEGKRDLSEGTIVLDMEPFELGRVPQVLAKLPVVDSEAATVAGRVELDLADGKVEVDGELRIDGLNVRHPILSRDVVRDVGFESKVRATVDPEARAIELAELELRRGKAAVFLTGEIIHPDAQEERRYSLQAKVPPTDCQAMLGAIPADLAPSLQGFVVEGKFHADVVLEVDYGNLDEVKFDTDLVARKCKVKQVPAPLDAGRLLRGFTHRVTMRDGRNRRVQLFSGSGSYTPLENISKNMVGAVLTTEDGGFWRHHGFLTSQFEVALQRNLQRGRVALGASTITMQMVKNVFLSHERTISRKLQEMVLTAYVERVLPKKRIMELYLNVIEFGPGIYGITAASHHYFGKHPADLTSIEAAYLALMLPSPVRRHAYYCRGELTPRFDAKLRRIHTLMVDRGRIEEEEYYLWKESPLVFDPLRVVNTPACLAEIDSLMEARAGQRALTGLLGDGVSAADDFGPERKARAEVALPDVVDDPTSPDLDGVPAMERP